MMRKKAGTSSQKLMLLRRGNAMSGAPIMIGTNQLPKPPIIAGMTTKKIMMRPCAVTTAFHCCPVEKICMPGVCNSARIRMDSAPPTSPPHTAKIK